jgi:predicted house-cleaning noncanonical NTP pyrophosphatase (MazG superfamily)
MKKEQKDAEDRLLSSASLDELIKIKMEQEIKQEFDKSKNQPKIKLVTDISKVPQALIFSKKSVFKMFNRTNKSETYLNGVQAEALIGLQSSVRDKINSGLMDAFSTEDAYVKFESVEV